MRWYNARRPAWLAAAGFVFGLGIFDKASFLWLLAALTLAGAAAGLFRKDKLPGPATLLGAATALLAGSAGYWIYQLTPSESTIALSVETHAQHWLAKAAMLRSTLDGTALQGWATNACGDLISSSWLPWALVAAALSWPWLRNQPYARVCRFSAVFCAASWLCMAAVETAGSVHHFALVYPFPQLGLAAAIAAIPRKRIALVVGLLLCGAGARTASGLLLQSTQCGGSRYWSEAIYRLADELQKRQPMQVAVIDWGIAAQLRLLSGDRLPINELSPGAPAPDGALLVRYNSPDPLTGFVLVDTIADHETAVFEIFEPR